MTYGLAIDILVGTVTAAAGGGVVVYAIKLYKTQPQMLWLGAAPLVGALITWRLQRWRSAQWQRERDEWAQGNADAGAGDSTLRE